MLCVASPSPPPGKSSAVFGGALHGSEWHPPDPAETGVMADSGDGVRVAAVCTGFIGAFCRALQSTPQLGASASAATVPEAIEGRRLGSAPATAPGAESECQPRSWSESASLLRRGCTTMRKRETKADEAGTGFGKCTSSGVAIAGSCSKALHLWGGAEHLGNAGLLGWTPTLSNSTADTSTCKIARPA